MTMAEPLARASTDRACSLLLGQHQSPASRKHSLSCPQYLLGDNVILLQVKKISLVVSFRNAWQVRISTTTQYKSVYVIFEQLMMLAFLLVC